MASALQSVSIATDAEPAGDMVQASPRRSKRLSDSRNNENAAPGANSEKRSKLNRFGFKKRSLPAALVPGSNGEPDVGERCDEATAAPAIDLTSQVNEVLGDLDGFLPLLRSKPTADKFDRKMQLVELTDIMKNLKRALADQLERGRRVAPALAEAQEEINSRLHALGEEARAQRSMADRTNEELAAARKLAEERQKKIKGLTETGDFTARALETQKERTAQEGERADVAERSLAERESQLGGALEEIRALKEANAAEAEAVAKAREECERLSAEGTATAESLASTREEAQRREAELSASLDAQAARATSLEGQLATATAEAEQLKERHASLSREHSAQSETLAATKARLESATQQLEEKSATLKQKDADLRESLQTVTQMQKDHNEVIQHERQRSSALEEEARALRTREQEATASMKAAEAETERVRAELDLTRSELSTASNNLASETSRREKLTIESAERQEALAALQNAHGKLEAKLSESVEQLASVSATLAAKREEADGLSRAKHELEVEYRSYQEHHGSSNQQQMAAISELKLTVDRLSEQVQTKSEQVVTYEGTTAAQQAYLESLEAKLREQEGLRRALHNTIQELKGNIRVFCRVRPPTSADAPRAIESADSSKLSLSYGSDSHAFGFDKVFGSGSRQEDIFTEVDGLVQSSLDGYKVCIFAYGQTGSGKTFTMQGGTEPQSWGLIPRALSKILSTSEAMRADGWTWSMQATFLEIYNETLRDLLHSGSGAQPSYAIKHDEAWGTVVANMSRVDVDSMEQINRLMARAAKARAVGCTDMNSQSSRSHSIFALYLKGTNEKTNTELHGALHLVDLAGSERLDKSGAVGAALKETQAINKSLSSLADVFMAKSSGAPHVPFRNSKLTHLMEPCLSGHGKTLMVVNVAPEQENAHESLCSLRFARQVNQCDTGNAQARQPKRNVKSAAPAPAAPPAKRPQTAAPAGKRVAK